MIVVFWLRLRNHLLNKKWVSDPMTSSGDDCSWDDGSQHLMHKKNLAISFVSLITWSRQIIKFWPNSNFFYRLWWLSRNVYDIEDTSRCHVKSSAWEQSFFHCTACCYALYSALSDKHASICCCRPQLLKLSTSGCLIVAWVNLLVEQSYLPRDGLSTSPSSHWRAEQ